MSRRSDRHTTISVIPEVDRPRPDGDAPAEPVAPGAESKPPVRPRDPSVYERNRIVCHAGHTPEVDLFRLLATQVQIWLDERQGHSVAITSCGAGEGKTLMAVNLAICLAKNSDRETVLVDADLRRPNVANCLGIEPDVGLEHVLTGKAALDDVLLRSEIDGLFLLPMKSALAPSSRLLATARLGHLAEDIEAMNRERLVVYDMAPILLGDSCAPFVRAADGCLLVVEDGRTTRSHLRRAVSLVKEEKLIGVTLNKASEHSAHQRGYFSYDYYTDDR
jgi:protein-tyrosine kinase